MVRNSRRFLSLLCGFGMSLMGGATVQVLAAPPRNIDGERETAVVAPQGSSAYASANPFQRSPLLSFGRQAQDSTTATTTDHSDGWVLSGPYFLRSADPEEPGELELKFIYGFELGDADEEEHEFEFVLEWGMAQNWEFIFEVPVELGEGKVEGNGDIGVLGFHTKFWDEDGWMPAFAMRNLVRLPTGYHSDGVDYTARGLFTKTLIPGSMRLHFNPFMTSVNGNLEEGERRFQWGAAIGVGYRMNDDLLLIADYQVRSSEEEGSRNNHTLELGADWTFAPHQKLAFETEFELDGDGNGSNWGAHISYIFSIDAPRLDAP